MSYNRYAYSERAGRAELTSMNGWLDANVVYPPADGHAFQ